MLKRGARGIADSAGAGPQIAGIENLTPLPGAIGASATVYLGRESAYARQVAVKVMSVGITDAAGIARFRREAQAVGPLSWHPNVITVHTAGTTPDGRPYLTMQYVAGGSLADRLTTAGAFPVEQALRIGIRISGALHAAHALTDAEGHPHGLIHRDVKPQNILLGPGDDPILADFGVAVLAERAAVQTATAFTVVHAPPEVLAGGSAPSPPGDVYSLCSTLFELLNGVPAFPHRTGEGHIAHAVRVMNEPVPRLSRPDAPGSLVDLLVRGMAKQPDLRPTAGELVRGLQAVEQERGFPPTQAILRERDDDDAGFQTFGGGTGGASLESGGTEIVRPVAAAPLPVVAPPRPRWPIAAAVAAVVVLGGAAFFVVRPHGSSSRALTPAPVLSAAATSAAPVASPASTVSTSGAPVVQVSRSSPTALKVSWTSSSAGETLIGYSVSYQVGSNQPSTFYVGATTTTTSIKTTTTTARYCVVGRPDSSRLAERHSRCPPKPSAPHERNRMTTAPTPQVPGVTDLVALNHDATVFSGTEAATNRAVVVSVVRPDLSAAEAAAVATATWLGEYDGVAGVTGVVAGEAGTRLVFEERLEGTSLRAMLKSEGSLSIQQALAVVTGLTGILGVAHTAVPQRVVGPLSPDFVTLQADGTPSVMSVSRAVSGASAARFASYTAPEILVDNALPSTAADIYTLGCVVHETLSGQVPFPRSENTMSLEHLHRIAVNPPPRLMRPDLPAALAELILACLAKRPGDRPTVMEVASRLAVVRASLAAPAQAATVPPLPVVPLPASAPPPPPFAPPSAGVPSSAQPVPGLSVAGVPPLESSPFAPSAFDPPEVEVPVADVLLSGQTSPIAAVVSPEPLAELETGISSSAPSFGAPLTGTVPAAPAGLGEDAQFTTVMGGTIIEPSVDVIEGTHAARESKRRPLLVAGVATAVLLIGGGAAFALTQGKGSTTLVGAPTLRAGAVASLSPAPTTASLAAVLTPTAPAPTAASPKHHHHSSDAPSASNQPSITLGDSAGAAPSTASAPGTSAPAAVTASSPAAVTATKTTHTAAATHAPQQGTTTTQASAAPGAPVANPSTAASTAPPAAKAGSNGAAPAPATAGPTSAAPTPVKTTPAPAASSPPPSAQEIVSISKGAQHMASSCTDASCAYILVSYSNFPAGSHTLTCFDNGQQFYSYSAASSPSSNCFEGNRGHQVFVTVDGIQSNVLTW